MVTRISGLSSGMDIDGLVEKLMTAERAPLDKVEQKQQDLEWKKDSYREVNRSTLTYDQKLFNTYKLESKWKESDGSYNVDNVMAKLKEFVDDYNKNVEFLSGKVNEREYRDYQPLTEAQKADMKDREIEQWEQKAKSGLLKNDSTITQSLSTLRTSIYEGTNGDYGSLVDLGITTSSNWRDGGKLVIDEKKLREKLEADPQKAIDMITGTGGVVDKVRSTLKTMQKGIERKTGAENQTESQYLLGRENIRLEEQKERLISHLQHKEEQYWRQFTAMEKALSKMNAQSAMLFNSFNQG